MLNRVSLYWKAFLCIIRRSFVLKGAFRTVRHSILKHTSHSGSIALPHGRTAREICRETRYPTLCIFAELSEPKHIISVLRIYSHATVARLLGCSACRELARPLAASGRTPQYQRNQLPHPSHPTPHTPNLHVGECARPNPAISRFLWLLFIY